MNGDITRSTFSPEKHYSGVRMQQGRVQLDSDWNEQVDVQLYRTETQSTDVIGPSGAPSVITMGVAVLLLAGGLYILPKRDGSSEETGLGDSAGTMRVPGRTSAQEG